MLAARAAKSRFSIMLPVASDWVEVKNLVVGILSSLGTSKRRTGAGGLEI